MAEGIPAAARTPRAAVFADAEGAVTATGESREAVLTLIRTDTANQ